MNNQLKLTVSEFGSSYDNKVSKDIFASPESAFYQYQIKLEKQLCQICKNQAAGFHHNAFVCEACKKFFKRYSQNLDSGLSSLVCLNNCDLDKIGRRKCSDCRYRKCMDIGMHLIDSRQQRHSIDISQIPCRVCSGKSSGFHFGSLTCEGCKGFFRRAAGVSSKLSCLTGQNNCVIHYSKRLMCKLCRYNRCCNVGMSRYGSRIGRQPNAVKYECAKEISKLGTPTIGSPQQQTDDMTTGASLPTQSPRNNQYCVPSNHYPHHRKLLLSPTTLYCQPIPRHHHLHGDDSFIFNMQINTAICSLQTPFQQLEMKFAGQSGFICRQRISLDSTREHVCRMMMQQFQLHLHLFVDFAKTVPHFNSLKLQVRRNLIRQNFYRVILLNLLVATGDVDGNSQETFMVSSCTPTLDNSIHTFDIPTSILCTPTPTHTFSTPTIGTNIITPTQDTIILGTTIGLDNQRTSPRYNYFDFNATQYHVIAHNFPVLTRTVMSHVVSVQDLIIHQLHITHYQNGLICVLQLLNYSDLTDGVLDDDSQVLLDNLHSKTLWLLWSSILEEYSNTSFSQSSISMMNKSHWLAQLHQLNCPADLIGPLAELCDQCLLWKLDWIFGCCHDTKVSFSWPLDIKDNGCGCSLSNYSRTADGVATRCSDGISGLLANYNAQHKQLINQLNFDMPQLPLSHLYNEMFIL